MSEQSQNLAHEEEFDAETAPMADLEKKIMADWDATEGEEEVNQESEPEKKTVFRREIDLGDGSGKQVFESDTMEGLLDALTQAQTHATKKIRELSKDKKVDTAAAKEPERELTADEEYILAQEMLNHPSKTQKKLIEGLFGMPIEEVRESIQAAKETRLERDANKASDQFVKNHANDYFPCPENREAIAEYMETYQLAPSVANLEKAFNHLSKSGLLKAKPVESAQQEGAESETAEHQETTRIATKTVQTPVQPQRRTGSGLSTRGRAPVPARTQYSEQDLYEMPLEKLEQLANAALRSGKS